MATFFGEILPVISRAVEDDDGDDIFIEPNLVWKSVDETVGSIDYLVVAVGRVATGFIEGYFLRNKDVMEHGSIIEVVEDQDPTNNKLIENQLATVHVNSSNPAVAYCMCNSYIAPDKLWHFKDKLFSLTSLMQLKEVIVLDSASIHEYLHHLPSSELTAPVVRSLSTTCYDREKLKFRSLEQPNMVKHVAAAVLTHCELTKIPAVAYICYTDSINLDLASVKAFTPLLHQIPLIPDNQDKSKALDHVKMLLSIRGSEQSLYI